MLARHVPGRSRREDPEADDVVLRTLGLPRRFGDLLAVDGLSLEVRQGEVFGLLGPNGAGKTTAISMMCGLLAPDSGRTLIRGQPVRAGSPDVRARVGVCPQEIVVWKDLSCLEQLVLVGALYGLDRSRARSNGAALLDRLGLGDRAASLARALSGGMQRRLQLTRMTAFDFLLGVSAVQVLVAIASLLLTFAVAWALGFRSEGPLWAAILVGSLTSLAVVGLGLVVACFARTATRAFLVANLPFTLLMSFSGAIFPLGEVEVLHLGGRAIGLWDVLPPTHAVVSLNKILSLGAGLSEVAWELCWLAGLSCACLACGVALFRRTHLRPRR